MSLTLVASGTSAAADRTPGTEHSLTTITSAGIYLFCIDTAALADGQTLGVQEYIKVLSGGTERQIFASTPLSDTQGNAMKCGIPVPSDISYRVGITETSGTEHSYPWKVLKLGTPTLVASGTSAAGDRTPDAEHDLATSTTAGTYQFFIDLNALADGQTLTVKTYLKCLTGGTERTYTNATYLNAQGNPAKCSLPVASDISYRVGITEHGGSEQSYPWKVLGW